MLDIEETRKLSNRENKRYFWIVLLGKLKGEHIDREHNVSCSNTTKTGIEARKVIEES